MKVAILTLPLHSNYGGNLQAYAMIQVLIKLGHQVTFVRRLNNRKLFYLWPLRILKRLIWRILGLTKEPILKEFKDNRDFLITNHYAKKFIDQKIIPVSRDCFSSSDLRNLFLEYDFDAVIIGSDQVWRPAYTPDILDYFLGFLPKSMNVRKISYAASFGTDEWLFDGQKTEKCGALLRQFDSVSVRERSAVDICLNRFHVHAEHVLDPTMLLSKTDYLSLVSKNDLVKNNYRNVSYVLDENAEVDHVLQQIDTFLGGTLVKINSRIENKSAPLVERIAPPVEGWISSLFNCNFIVTDSFHACVFSILFNKQFVVFSNSSRGAARFDSLLSLFNLNSRIITNMDDFEQVYSDEIDWNSVNDRVSELRETSLQYLKSSLSSRRGD